MTSDAAADTDPPTGPSPDATPAGAGNGARRPGPRRIRVTSCTALKDEGARASGEPVPPDVLYVDPLIQRFFAEARAARVPWCVLSDEWGLLLESDRAPWYERHPDTVDEQLEAELVRSVEAKLAGYDRVEYVPLRDDPHPLYERVLRAADTGAELVVAPRRTS